MNRKEELKNYVVNCVVRNNLEPNELLRRISLLSDDPKLNDHQQAVFGWLIDCYKESEDPVTAVSDLYDETRPCDFWKSCLEAAFKTLDNKQQFEVLAVFASWGLSEVSG
ncbi:hypothetical protein [Enterococcus sp. AZ072]|uniref:hypothetical protein n=1 Tax=unclassified Enterococcus TaxID=2608891 RepID=UPI003D2AAF67